MRRFKHLKRRILKNTKDMDGLRLIGQIVNNHL
jgi:hypothetical protein